MDVDDTLKDALLRSLQQVGPAKPVGYPPLSTVTDVLGLEVDDLIRDAIARGLAAVRFGPERCCIKSGAIYVYDCWAVAAAVRDATDNLTDYEIPSDPDGFVQYIAANWLDEDHPAYAIIVRAFGGPA